VIQLGIKNNLKIEYNHSIKKYTDQLWVGHSVRQFCKNSAFFIVLLLSGFNLVCLPALAACSSPAASEGAIEYFSGSALSCSPMIGGQVCGDPFGSAIASNTTGSSGACATWCETFPTATCCAWSDGDGSCIVYEAAAIEPWSSGIISEAANCVTASAGYMLCDGTNWQTVSLEIIPAGSCSVAGALEYDAVTKKYKICDGADYYPINCVGACTTYGSCSSEAARNYVASNGMRWCDGTNWKQMKAP
jgi:hypothetical protein